MAIINNQNPTNPITSSQKRGSGFTNFQTYTKANDPSLMTGSIQSGIGQDVSKIKDVSEKEEQKAQTSYNSQLGNMSFLANQAKKGLGDVVSGRNTADIGKAASNVADIQKNLAGSNYQNPNAFGQTGQQAQQFGQLTTSNIPLLQRYVGRGPYTQRQQAFDASILGQSAQTPQLAQKIQGSRSLIADLLSRNAQAEQGRSQEIKRLAGQNVDELQKQASSYVPLLTGAAQDQAKQGRIYNTVLDRVKSGTSTNLGQDLASLGLDPQQSSTISAQLSQVKDPVKRKEIMDKVLSGVSAKGTRFEDYLSPEVKAKLDALGQFSAPSTAPFYDKNYTPVTAGGVNVDYKGIGSTLSEVISKQESDRQKAEQDKIDADIAEQKKMSAGEAKFSEDVNKEGSDFLRKQLKYKTKSKIDKLASQMIPNISQEDFGNGFFADNKSFEDFYNKIKDLSPEEQDKAIYDLIDPAGVLRAQAPQERQQEAEYTQDMYNADINSGKEPKFLFVQNADYSTSKIPNPNYQG